MSRGGRLLRRQVAREAIVLRTRIDVVHLSEVGLQVSFSGFLHRGIHTRNSRFEHVQGRCREGSKDALRDSSITNHGTLVRTSYEAEKRSLPCHALPISCTHNMMSDPVVGTDMAGRPDIYTLVSCGEFS